MSATADFDAHTDCVPVTVFVTGTNHGYPWRAVCPCGWASRGYAARHAADTMDLNIASLIGKRLQVIGTALRARPLDGPEGKWAIAEAVVASVWPMIATGTVRPVIGARFPIEQAGEAHRVLAAGETVGKILLDVAG